jgi:hypothetical protein
MNEEPGPLDKFLKEITALAKIKGKNPPWNDLQKLGRNSLAKTFAWSPNDQRFRPSRFNEFPLKAAKALRDDLQERFRKAGKDVTLPEPNWTICDGADPRQAWLDRVHAAIAVAQGDSDGEEADQTKWRVLARSDLVTEVAAKLADHVRVAITGMSGIGKSLLADQYLKHDIHGGLYRKIWFDAPQIPDGQEIPPRDALFRFALAVNRCLLQESELPSGKMVERAKGALLSLGLVDSKESRAELLLLDPKSSGPGESLVNWLSKWLAEVAKWEDLVRCLAAVVMPLFRLKTIHHRLVLIIDDVWAVETMKPLFTALASQSTPHIRVLMTSQNRNASLLLDPGKTVEESVRAEVSIEPDREATRKSFGISVAAVWAAPEQSPPIDLAPHIEGYRKRVIASPEILAALDALDYHPLAVAALAAAWRNVEYNPKFWSDCVKDLNQGLPADLGLVDGPRRNERHGRIVAALLFALSVQSKEVQERFEDLVISPKETAIDVFLFMYLWRHLKRGGNTYSLSSGRQPFRDVYAPSALVQPDLGRGGVKDEPGHSKVRYKLHDMHRAAIVAKLGPMGVAQRHDDLLKVLGLVDEGCGFRFGNEDIHVERPPTLGSFAGLPRYRVAPRLQPGDNALEDRARIGTYLTSYLQHHVRASDFEEDNSRDGRETMLLSNYGFLQSLLDFEDFESGLP